MVHEIEIRREVAHRLDATFKVLSAKIGKHGSATHHLANVLGAMSLAFTGSLSHWLEVVEDAGKLAAALRDEDLNEWRNLVSDAKPLEEATHLASRLGVLKRHLLEHTLGVTQEDSAEHVAQIAQYACLLAHTDAAPRDEAG